MTKLPHIWIKWSATLKWEDHQAPKVIELGIFMSQINQINRAQARTVEGTKILWAIIVETVLKPTQDSPKILQKMLWIHNIKCLQHLSKEDKKFSPIIILAQATTHQLGKMKMGLSMSSIRFGRVLLITETHKRRLMKRLIKQRSNLQWSLLEL